MGDRLKFVVNTSADFFNATCSHEDGTIKEFFENDELTLLAATRHDGKIQFHHRIPADQDCLIFYKVPQLGNIRPANGPPPLGLLTLEGGMVKSIYNSVSRIFSPHVSQRSEYGPELSGLLENLHVSLGSTLGLPQSGITSIQDEINFWNHKAANSSTKSDREQAQTFASILEKINKQIRQIDQTSPSSIEEFLDSAHNNLDEIWRLPYHYPQNRMADLMDVICSQIIETCVENLSTEDIWNLSSYHVNNLMNQVLDITESWLNLCDSLTRLFWPNYGQHPWIGKPHAPRKGQTFKERLAEIKNIKNLYRQIMTLLEDEDLREMFSWSSPFKAINIYDTSPMGQTRWNKALNLFEQLLQPIDERIALAIKAQIHSYMGNTRQVVFIFSKYDTLIQRPIVLDLLTTEREQLVQFLQILLQDLKKAISDTTNDSITENISPICNECRWLKVVQYQLQEIEKVIPLINGREGYETVNQKLQEFKEEVDTLLRTNYEIWTEQSISGIKSGQLKLRDDQPVVEFEREGRQLMKVTFNPELVSFCQDVREFENLGFKVSIELRASAVHAIKFMTHARRLQRIATFHNTIGDRMIPCQRPIMLKNAKELSKLVHSESVAWNDEESVKRYVNTLQTAVNRLSNDNQLLVGYHEQAKKTVVKLMNTDLLTQGQVWKDEMRHLREIVATLESRGYTNLDVFKLHWDHQLYKVLEYQYILGLADMNNKLPDIEIEIVFRQRQLQYRPPEEEIRAKYYSQLRRFVERPTGFRGLSDKSNELFKVMVERNCHHFGPLFRRGEELFKKLDELKKLWMPWVALGCVDIDELCSVHLSKWEHWDANFKACKHFSQQVAKIQNSEETLDCFVINILPLRTDIEFINRRYWEALANSLRISILNDIAVVQDFVQSSLQFLQNVPMDESEIAESGAKYEKIMTELPKITETLESVKSKDTCLAGWCKERVSSLSALLLQWEKLLPLIENHSVVLQRQVEIMRDHVTIQVVNLKDEAEKFLIRWESTIAELEANDGSSLDLFKERQQHWKDIKEKREKLLEESGKYNAEIPDEVTEIFDQIEKKVSSQGAQWELYEKFLGELAEVSKEEWTVYRRRPYILTEVLSRWETSANSSLDLASTRIRQSLETYQDALPVLQALQSDALTERHWAKILQILKKEAKPFHTILLQDILSEANLLVQNSNEIQNLVRQASSEQIVRQALTELDQWGVTAALKLTTHNDSAGSPVALIKDFQEILNKIGDNQSLLQSAKNSAAFDAFSDQAEIWESRLNTLDSILTSLNQCQRKWVYLEPVFGAGTLKNEEALFRRIDKDFRYIMREIQNDPRVLSLTKINNISSVISSLETTLSRCQNTLMSYITSKRNCFPRFYFLSDDDLLEILGQATKEEILQKHIKKLFPGIHSLSLEKSTNGIKIIKVNSAEGDMVTLKSAVQMNGPIENWLNELVTSIQITLKDLIRQCSQIQEFNEEVISKFPAQVICTARAINFTRQVEKSITSMSLQSILKSLKDEVGKFAELKNKTRSQLTQIKLRSLLFDLVHYVSVVEHLIRHSVTNHGDWHWLQQMKFYIDQESQVTIRMVFAEFNYSYEFLGNPNKLVHTSLTHKCYLTLTQAMHLGLGGNPFGPAGTGKTECVKALGGMMGRLVLVFNCDENVDTAAMGLILTGLARCGAWGCFDEFNRLQEATLSAISMLIQPIQSALKDKSKSVQILNETVDLNHHCGIFVTLNPAGEEYGGRQQLPGNIQALFRPIVMQQPEPGEIAKVMLFVEGFKNADEIGNRIVELFDLNGRMLSSQRHYDWGLRELKTVLLASGKLLRDKGSTTEEMTIVVEALKSNTMSKLNASDCKRFDMLLTNVFPEVSITDSQRSSLRNAIEEAFGTLGLEPNQKQVEKCLQLNEQLSKRMGVVVVGPPSSGKTTILSVLKQALSASSKTIRSYTISPKSMSRVQLLGKLDPDTRQWSDGVLTTTANVVNSEPLNVTSWIICDGDVDPDWIEALNSVLDDNKLLTLPSGWRIQFGDNVNFIFETHDLSFASPATISRMGIINLSSEDLEHHIIVENWLKRHEQQELIHSLLDNYLDQSLSLVRKDNTNSISVVEPCLVKSVLQSASNARNKDEFCVCLVQGLINFVAVNKQNAFANKIYEMGNIYITNPSRAEFTYFNSFRETIETFETDALQGLSESSDIKLIQSGQMKAYLEILRHFLKSDHIPFTIIGPSGVGKTLLLHHIVTEFTGYQLIVVNCSTQLTPNYILHTLKQNCITISGVRGREYKPQQSRILLFMKNVDLCFVDSWGTSDVIQLLMQLIHRNGFYSDNLEWIGVSGLQICCSMSDVPKQKISSRFLSINNFLQVKYPSEDDMKIIVENQLNGVLSHFKNPPNVHLLINGLIHFFTLVYETFTADRRTHYQFTPKMLSKLIQNLVNYPEDQFNASFIVETDTTFKSRLPSKDELKEYQSIWRDSLGNILPLDTMNETYFVPKGPKTAQLNCMGRNEWKDAVQKYVNICTAESYNIENPFTDEMILLTADISRILCRPESHLVLIGQAGNRRQDSLHVAAIFLGAKIHLLQGVKNYNIGDFYNDLKLAMQSSALEDQTIFLVIDHCWITFLPDIMKPIEAILQGSEILDLFGDDLETTASPLKASAHLEGYQESLASYFMKRVKMNLHIVLTLDAENNDLSDLFNTFPALYRSCELIWLQQPSMEMITILPGTIINHISVDKEEVPIPAHLMQMTLSSSIAYAPRLHYQLIRSYFHIFKSFNKNTKKQLEKLKTGVEKLSSAHHVVAELKANAIKQEVALAEKRKLANQALEMISTTMRNANDQKSDLLELKKKTQENSEILKERKKAIELELKDVEPILNEASAAVGQIKSEALSEIRSLRAPPEVIRDILEGVLRLMGIRDTSWNSMKTFLAKRGVKEDIRSLDPARISPENCESVERLLRSKSESFDIKNAKRASAAAAPLATWVIANVRYCKVVQSIKPLEREQNELQHNLEMAEGEMKSLMSGLDDVDARVKELSGQLNTYTQEAAVLELKLDEARNVLKSAEVLVEKLSAEFQNWSNQLQEITATNTTLDLKSFIIAISINYYSNLTIEKRGSQLNEITSRLQQPNFNITKSLISEQEQIIWESMGLQKDGQAVENAALLTKIIELTFGVCPTPLILDPSESAFTWLKEFLQSNGKPFEIISQNSEKLTYTLELSIRFGKILIVQDCQEIYPPLLQIIFARTFSKFSKRMMQVGTKFVDLHEDFKLVLFTKMEKIDLSAEIAAYIAQVPFTITAVGLTDQLMSKAILLKQPELEEKRINLLKSEGNLLKQRIDLQDKLLEELSTAQGDILKNEKLLKTLNEVKMSSSTIDKSLQESAEVKSVLLKEYDQFKDLAATSSNLYMGISKLYEMPVSSFIKLFLKSIRNADGSGDQKSYPTLVRATYQYLCRSFPKSDHITIGVYICKSAYPDQIADIEWELFVTNFMVGDDTLGQSCPSWVKKEQIPKVLTLRNHIPELYRKLDLENESLWRSYVDLQSPGKPELPTILTAFQKVLTSQIFRPDLMSKTMTSMISFMIGTRGGSVVQPTIEQLAEESSKFEPILVIAKSGNDPSENISNIVSKKLGKDMYIEMSMGKGMERPALENVRKATETGKWVCIKNVHLVPSWMQQLDRELDATGKIHENFRLWLICENTNSFPLSFTYKCTKILFEAPDGIKNKILRLLQQWSATLLSQKRDSKIIKLYIILFVLNSVLQERRNYIPQGWTKWYEFGDSDLRAAADILKWLDRGFGSQKMEWMILQGLCEHIAYGGRINDVHDSKILEKHLEEFFNDKTLTSRWSPFEWNINIPTSTNLQDYYEVFQQLPDVDPPESFGLCSSSNVSRDLAICRNVVKTLRSAYFQNDEQSNVEKRIRPILSLWKKLTGSLKVMTSSDEIDETASNTPWTVFLESELKVAGNLFKEIHKTLVHLHSVIKEIKSISNQDKQLINTIAENQVPLSWKKLWAGPKSVIDYIKSVVTKGIEAERRFKSDFHIDFTDSINFASIFNPASLLSALKLTNSHLTNKSACDLLLYSATSIFTTNGSIIMKVEPLLVDGGYFKDDKLTIFGTNSNENTSPEFYITFMNTESVRPKTSSEIFQLPVYSNASRDKLICAFNVPSNETSDKIILSGAALIIPEQHVT